MNKKGLVTEKITVEWYVVNFNSEHWCMSITQYPDVGSKAEYRS